VYLRAVKTLLRYLIVSLVLSAGLFGFNVKFPQWSLGMDGWILLFSLIIIYAASHFFIASAPDQKPAVFIRRFMASTTLRFLLFMSILVGYSFLNRDQAVPFILHFLIIYLILTIVEVASFFRHFRKK
jgi:hypothetical protein